MNTQRNSLIHGAGLTPAEVTKYYKTLQMIQDEHSLANLNGGTTVTNDPFFIRRQTTANEPPLISVEESYEKTREHFADGFFKHLQGQGNVKYYDSRNRLSDLFGNEYDYSPVGTDAMWDDEQ